MTQLESHLSYIKDAGAHLVYIAAEKRGGMFKPEQYLAKNPVSVPFLLDEDRTITKAYGLYHRIGLDAIHIAHPATLVIDTGKMVRYIYRGDSQVDRAPAEPVLAAARRLRD